jgi:hypothetical protein
MFKIIMQFIPGNDQIWVEQLTPSDPIYQYDDENEAKIKAEELQESDLTGRIYKVTNIL